MRKNNNKFDKLKTNFYKKAQNAYLMLAKKNKNYLPEINVFANKFPKW